MSDMDVLPDLTEWCRAFPHAEIRWVDEGCDRLTAKWEAIVALCKKEGLKGKDRARKHAAGHLKLAGIAGVQIHLVDASYNGTHNAAKPVHDCPQVAIHVRMVKSSGFNGRTTRYIGWMHPDDLLGIPPVSISGKRGSPKHHIFGKNDLQRGWPDLATPE